MKPGYKTTEFWLTLVAMIVGAVMASGILEQTATNLDNQVVGLIAMVLGGLGYTISRGFVKGKEAVGTALVTASAANPPQPPQP